jgi:hypothetical protein
MSTVTGRNDAEGLIGPGADILRMVEDDRDVRGLFAPQPGAQLPTILLPSHEALGSSAMICRTRSAAFFVLPLAGLAPAVSP